MGLEGKGYFIWKVRDCEKGNAEAIANAAQNADFTHVILKIADGPYPYNYDQATNTDFLEPVVSALRKKKISVWAWQYVYGILPTREADVAIRRIKDLNLDGFVIDAEIEYKEPGKANAANAFMNRLRSELKDLPLALSSFRFPYYHVQFPWKEFLEKCDYNMPQVYWEQAHNPSSHLERTLQEFQKLSPFRQIIPTGPTYKTGKWSPSTNEVTEFMDVAKKLDFKAVNFFSWDECRPSLLPLWDTISQYSWDHSHLTKEIPEKLIAALNTNNPEIIASLYSPAAVHITSARTVQGLNAIKAWYKSMFSELLPNAEYKITGMTGRGSSKHFTWAATSKKSKVINGNDTIGILNGKIAYHYTYFTVSNA